MQNGNISCIRTGWATSKQDRFWCTTPTRQKTTFAFGLLFRTKEKTGVSQSLLIRYVGKKTTISFFNSHIVTRNFHLDVLQGADYHIPVCAMAFHAYRILQLRAWCPPWMEKGWICDRRGCWQGGSWMRGTLRRAKPWTLYYTPIPYPPSWPT